MPGPGSDASSASTWRSAPRRRSARARGVARQASAERKRRARSSGVARFHVSFTPIMNRPSARTLPRSTWRSRSRRRKASGSGLSTRSRNRLVPPAIRSTEKGAVPLHLGDEGLGDPHRAREPLDEARKEVEGDRGEGPGGGESAAEHPPRVEHAVEQRGGAGEDGSRGRVEVLVEGHVDGVERAGQFGHVHPRIGAFKEHPRPVEVQPDALAPGVGGNAGQFSLIEGLAGAPPHRGLDRDHGDRPRNAPAAGPLHDLLTCSSVKVGRPGASGISGIALRVCTQSPESLYR